ncbi:DegT/DnrJ/EryC1/StrS family aminotransferase [Streptomyces sp. XH2]|uniref:DegT/DnrJ/EryC1/StrS family aminotransferase n=1 Tax=Streptomyces sp. XH2 TaxID=3412483 RepID=UPI003C7E10C1
MQIHRLRQLLSVERVLGPAPGPAAGTAGAAASADWSRRVRAVVERLARAGSSTLVATADGPPEESDGFVRERLLFDSPARGGFRAAVLAPAGTGPLPAVLVLGGRNARLDQLTGAEPPDHPDRDVAAHLARAGFLTLALDPGIDGGLDPDRLAGRDGGIVLAHAFALRGHSLLGALLGDALAALEWLRGHPRAAPGRTGLFGHSLGVAVALHTALLAPEPPPVCAAGHLGSYPALFARLLTGFEGAVLPGILDAAGRTVLTPVNTFFATAAAAVRAGARVRFVDVELDGLGMDPGALRRALDGERDVAAVVPVHIGGGVSPALETLLEECREHGVPVLEDAAHAFGSTLDGRAAGPFGRFGAFSFFPTKAATSGEGGLLTGARAGDLAAARLWRDHGRSPTDPGRHDRPGGNWRMGEPAAAVGTVGLERFGTALAARRAAAARYDGLLAGMGGLRPFPVPKASGSNFYKYLAYLGDGVDRAALKARLRERHGVALAGEVYDTLLCDQPFFRGPADAPGAFPRARWFAGRHVALPLYPSLTEAEQFRVAAALRSELR